MNKPVAFFSYAHLDNGNDYLTELHENLSKEISVHVGENVQIFRDRTSIGWGQNWRSRIEETLSEVVFLIPVISPSFFKSASCREELRAFLEREKKTGRPDSVLPIYLIDTPLINDEKRRGTDDLAQAVSVHQWEDWRKLRNEDWTSQKVKENLTNLAIQIRDAMESQQAQNQVNASAADSTNEPANKGEDQQAEQGQGSRLDFRLVERLVANVSRKLRSHRRIDSFWRSASSFRSGGKMNELANVFAKCNRATTEKFQSLEISVPLYGLKSRI